MTPQALFSLFLAGKTLPTLTSANCRALLDLARDKILSLGRKPRFHAGPGTTAEEKARLLQAHRELQEVGAAAGAGQVYAMATPEKLPTIAEVEECLAMLQKHNATPRKSSNKITPKPQTAPQTMTSKATARPPATPPPRKESTDEYLARRVAEQQSAARATAAAAPKVELRPLAEVETGELVTLSRHQFAKPSEQAAALAELANRKEVTVFQNGSYSVSYARPAKK